MNNRKTIGWWLIAAMLVLVLSGCSGNGNGGSAVEDNWNDAGGLTEIPEEEQGSVTFTDATGSDMTSSSVNERPDALPDEIPLPADAVIQASFVQEEKNNVTLTFESEQAFDSVIALYQQFTTEAGYKESMPITVEDDAYWFAGGRDTEQLVVILGIDLERPGVMHGTITYQDNK